MVNLSNFFKNVNKRPWHFLVIMVTTLLVHSGWATIVQHQGRWIVDQQGRVLIFHGVNMVNKLAPYTLTAAGFGEQDAEILEAEGFNVVRVGVIYSAVEPSPGVYDDNYIQSIKDSVKMLARHGIWSLLDFHQDLYGPVFQGEGFPKWATQTDGLSTGPGPKGFPYDYFDVPGIARAFENFWKNQNDPTGIGLQDRYASAWGHVADHFANTPGLLGYDLMNEPFPGELWKECMSPSGCPNFEIEFLTSFWKKVISSIREKDPSTTIFYEPNLLFNLGVGQEVFIGPLDDSYLGLSYHPYLKIDQVLEKAENHSKKTGVALLATEWGATTDVNVIEKVANQLDHTFVSWIYWTWANKTPYKIPESNILPNGSENQGIVQDLSKERIPGNVHMDRLNALARPYARAIAGTPHSFFYDTKKQILQLTYNSLGVSGRPLADETQTEIFCPKRHYPNGYKVTTTGAKVISTANAKILRLVNDTGTNLITVKIERNTIAPHYSTALLKNPNGVPVLLNF